MFSVLGHATAQLLLKRSKTTLWVSSSLKGLHLWGRITNERMVGTLLNTLLHKPTLEELSFENITLDWNPYVQALKEYLSSTTALKVFTMSTSNRSLQRAVLEGVLENTSIEKLSLSRFKGTEENTALVSRIIREKRAIPTLSILSSDDPFEQHSLYDCWVQPLIQNDVLVEVTLSVSMLHTTKWSDFLRVLPTKQNLKMVNLMNTSSYPKIRWLCTELKDSGSEEKVYLGYDPDFRQSTEQLHCKAIWGANLWTVQPGDHLLAVVRQLPNFQGLRVLGIPIRSDHMRLSLALAEFLRSATALHTLDLRIKVNGPQQANAQNPWWKIILESIGRSKTVKNLHLTVSGMSIQDSHDLADSVKHNTCITELYLGCTPKANNTAFFRRLSQGIEENYTLASLKFEGGLDADCGSHWLAVEETTWRNSGLVPRAARIKQASKSDRYVTRAVDRVSRYPGLLEEVARRAKLDQSELAALVRDRLMAIQSLDGFMGFVGVVKERVMCHSAEDGRVQLDDLNEDCWRHVRRYLVADDVRCDTVELHHA
ncbi:hypothetical protein HPB51_009559 [Rhipicephalus microplus]|uniref:Nlr family card domain protein n=1 Tax=Rhipicephalus microplus TaxID=6941 RepID=A0A9J6F1B6_RHIMP|nr:hypothetical protein HPB51_009559 [Rhipicephalus microplus]